MMREAIRANAAGLVLAHCHPSGSFEPSESTYLDVRGHHLTSAHEVLEALARDGSVTSMRGSVSEQV